LIEPAQLGLPYPEFRPFQLEAIFAIAEAFQSGKKYVVCEAPPGSGKTGIAAGVSRFLDADSIFLTATKDLQSQYVRDVRVEKMVGRGNYQCLIDPRLTAAQARCVSLSCKYAGAKGQPGCPYFDDLHHALAAPEVVLNYPGFLHHANYADNFTDRSLLVCDEAHMLRSELESFVNATLIPSKLNQLGLMESADARACEGWGIGQWLDWAQDSHALIAQELDKLKLLYDVEYEGNQAAIKDSLRERANALGTVKRSLDTIIRSPDNLVLEVKETGIRFRPVWVAPFTQRLLLRHAERALFLTATPGDFDVFCQSIGLNPKDTQLVRCPSTFSKDRRPIYYQPVIKVLGGRNTPASADALTPAIDQLIEGYGSRKGIIHTVSYPLAQAILQRSRFKDRMLTHLTDSREAVLNSFRQSEDSILLSPSMTTGVDLPYDQLRWQVIAKLPFADRSDPVLMAQAETELGKKLSLQDTAVTLCQAYGRIMRSEDDYGSTHLLDKNWDWARWAMKTMIPSWFTEAMVKT
jgi:ATP-dependent DNA helicase DinG